MISVHRFRANGLSGAQSAAELRRLGRGKEKLLVRMGFLQVPPLRFASRSPSVGTTMGAGERTAKSPCQREADTGMFYG